MIDKPIWIETLDLATFARGLPEILARMMPNDPALSANQEMARRILVRADHERMSRYSRQKLAWKIESLPEPYWESVGRKKVNWIIGQMKRYCSQRIMIFDLTARVRDLSCPENCSERLDDEQLLLRVSSREIIAAIVTKRDYQDIHAWYDIELDGWRR